MLKINKDYWFKEEQHGEQKFLAGFTEGTKIKLWAGKTAQQVKAPGAKSDNLSNF